MKKLVAILGMLLSTYPAMAADWSFSGSVRFASWYVDRDYGDYQPRGSHDDQGMLFWFQDNTRLEAKVRADRITGHIELALGVTDTGRGGQGDDTDVSTRRAYGVWKFADKAWLKIGKDYSPVTEFTSNQWFNSDLDLLGIGNFFGRRPAGLTLGIGDLELALLTPSYGADLNTTTSGINGATGGDPDSYIPRIEASYALTFDAGFIKPFGGFQYYTVKDTGTGNITGDLDVWSWVIGVATTWYIGAFSIGGNFSYGMNEGNVRGWQAPDRSIAAAYLKGGDNLANVYTLQAAIVPALTVTDSLRFEAGFGYRMDNPDGAPGPSQPDGQWCIYLQAMITLAPGVFLCPEIGFFDIMEDRRGNDEGHLWYAGAKWQIDF
jgi:hypothetical protein